MFMFALARERKLKKERIAGGHEELSVDNTEIICIQNSNILISAPDILLGVDNLSST